MKLHTIILRGSFTHVLPPGSFVCYALHVCMCALYMSAIIVTHAEKVKGCDRMAAEVGVIMHDIYGSLYLAVTLIFSNIYV